MKKDQYVLQERTSTITSAYDTQQIRQFCCIFAAKLGAKGAYS